MVGLKTKVVSSGVMLDSTAPSAGMVRIGNSHKKNYYLASNHLVVHWMGFRDHESGIDHIHVGVGTSPDADDVIQFEEQADKDHMQLTDVWNLKDGHQYYALVKVQNYFKYIHI